MKKGNAYRLVSTMASASGKSIKEAAEGMGRYSQWLYDRLHKEKFSLDEWVSLANEFDYDFHIVLSDRNSNFEIKWPADNSTKE